MCGICGVFALDGIPRSHAQGCRARDERRDRPPRPRRRRLLRRRAGRARPSPAGDHRPRRRPPADGQRRRHLLDRLQRRDLQPPRAAAACSKSKGHRFRTVVRHRDDPPRLRGVRPGVRRSARGHVRLRDLRRPPARAVRRARSRSARSRSSTPSRRRVSLRQRAAGARARARSGTATLDLTALEGYLSLGYFLAPAHDLPRRAQADARPLAARRERPRRDAQVLGRHRVRHRSAATTEALHRRDRRHAARRRCTIGSRAKCRSARSCQRRHRFRAGRVRTWPRRSAIGWSRRRSGSASARTTSSKRPALTAAHFGAGTTREIIEPRARRGARPGRRSHRRAAGRFVGDSDLVRLAGRAAARHRGAQRRRRRRDVRRLRLPLRAARDRRGRRVDWCPASPGRRLAGWLGARMAARRRALPRPLRLGTLLENLSRDPAAAYYAGPLLPQAARGALAARAARHVHDLSDSPVYDAVTEPYRRCPSTSRCSGRSTRPQGLHAERSARESRSHEHGAQPRGALPAARSPVVELAFRIPAARKLRGRTGKVAAPRARATPPAGRAGHASEARLHGADRRVDRRARTATRSPRSPRARLEGQWIA